MNWRVELTDPAKKDMARLDKPVAVRVVAALRKLAGELTEHGRPVLADVKKLAGTSDEWRMRVGDYRVRFTRATVEGEHEPEGVITVHLVRHRREVYRD